MQGPAGGSGEALLSGRGGGGGHADTGEKAQSTAGYRVWALFGRQRAKAERQQKKKKKEKLKQENIFIRAILQKD